MKKVLEDVRKEDALAFLEKKFRRSSFFDYAYKATQKLKGIKLAKYIFELFDHSKKFWTKPDGQPPDCKRGCSYCCYLQVDLSKYEALYLARHIKKNFTKPEIAELKEKAKKGYEEIKDADADWYPGKFRPCILLDTKTGDCRAYDARPLSCRRVYSYEVKKCETGFQGLTNDNKWWGGPYMASEDIAAGIAYADLERDKYEEYSIDSALLKYLK